MNDLKTLLMSLQTLIHMDTLVTIDVDALLIIDLPKPIVLIEGNSGSQLWGLINILVLYDRDIR